MMMQQLNDFVKFKGISKKESIFVIWEMGNLAFRNYYILWIKYSLIFFFFNQQQPLNLCQPCFNNNPIMSLEQETTPKKSAHICSECLLREDEGVQKQCTSCYLKEKQTQKEEMPTLSPIRTPKSKITQKEFHEFSFEELIKQGPKKQQKDKKRCFGCNKKTGLLGIQCKCGFIFCAKHRLPQEHNCDFNHRHFELQKLKKEVQKVAASKIMQI